MIYAIDAQLKKYSEKVAKTLKEVRKILAPLREWLSKQHKKADQNVLDNSLSFSDKTINSSR